MEEEPSELERLCLEVRAQLEALSDEDDDEDASSTDTDEECIMAADAFPREASHEIRAEVRQEGSAAIDGQEYASSSRMSSGTLYNASGSYEQSFLAGARPSGNVMSEVSRCSPCLPLLLPPGPGSVNDSSPLLGARPYVQCPGCALQQSSWQS